jgi:hypothetical protein
MIEEDKRRKRMTRAMMQMRRNSLNEKLMQLNN